jgi:hypothetical protein
VAPDLTPEQQAIQDKRDALADSTASEEDVRLTGGRPSGFLVAVGTVAVCTLIGWELGASFHFSSTDVMSGGSFAPIGGIVGFVVGVVLGVLVWASWRRAA